MAGRRVWADKTALLVGGSDVVALSYGRASQDRKGQGKSVADQLRLNRGEASRHGWTLEKDHEFSDNAKSASRYARKKRESYYEMLDAIRSGVGDVLIFFELSRSQRDLAVYVDIRELCVKSGLYFWLIGGQLYDLRNRADRMSLGFQAVQAEDQSEYIRDNAQRGIDGAAVAGKPPGGKPAFGFRRIYDEQTGAFVAQVPDDIPQIATGVNGIVCEYTRAGVVDEMFERVDSGVPLAAIVRSLNLRGVPAPKGGPWRQATVRKLLLNPAYIGKRVLRGEIVGDAVWDGLVQVEVFWSVTDRLNASERKTTRAGGVKWLLSYFATCAECGSLMEVDSYRRRPVYRCKSLARCSVIEVAVLDSYVEASVVAWLSRSDVYRRLEAAYGAKNPDLAAARAEVKRLEVEKEKWLADAAREMVKAATVARWERNFDEQIEAARERANQNGVPAVVLGVAGKQAAKEWAAIVVVSVKREVLRAVCTVSVKRALKKDETRTEDRIIWGGPIVGEKAS